MIRNTKLQVRAAQGFSSLFLQLHAGWKWKGASTLAVDLDSVLLKVPHSLRAKAESDFQCICNPHKSTTEKAWNASAGFQ